MSFSVRLPQLLAVSLASLAHIDAGLSQTTPAPPQRGQLLANPPVKVGSYTDSDLLSMITDGTISQWLLQRTFSPRCSVGVYQLQYGTIGAQAEPTTASGALMIPTGSDSACQGARPIVLYAHGKRNLKWFNLANLDGNYEALVLALALAGDGYIVVAPNYAGYDTSTLGYHPFLNAIQQPAEMIDALAAARAAFPGIGVADNGKLFVSGYSEGGHVAMATHRAMQAAGIPVTASAPMSGPYALSAFADAMFMGQVGGGAVEEFAMLVSSYQHAYGNIYASPTDVFESKYASADTLLPSTVGIDQLVAQGQLPESAVFSSTPPTPELAPLTPATNPRWFAQIFASGFGADNLVTNAFRLSYLEDASTAPDGGYPNDTSGLPPAAPANALRLALKMNDLRNWAPTTPVLLCAGGQDPVVFILNTQLMQQYWAANAPETPVTVLDVEAASYQGDPYKHLKKEFAATKKVMTLIEGKAAVQDDYHDILVPAFCVQAAKSFFDGF
jgi:hypothetical protein